MNFYKLKYLISVSVLILAVVSTMALTRRNRASNTSPKAHQEKQQIVDTLPLVVSQVKDLEVIKASLENPGTSRVAAVLEIKNKSDKPVIAVSVEIGAPEEAAGITVNGFKEGDELPDVVIEAHGTITVRLSLNNATPGDPIRVSGVVYADNSEDGEKTALETIRGQREHTKSNKLKTDSLPKAKNKGVSSPR